MKQWEEIDSALNSELESFDQFMTAKNIEGEKTETFTRKEVKKIGKILEKPVPERFVQEKLLEEHIKH